MVDDGSPDKCGALCDAFAFRDTRFKVLHKQNAGVSAARNDGIKIANGEWVYFVDSDDWLELDAVERLLAAAEATGVDCVMSYSEMVFDDGHRKMSPLFSESFLATERSELDELQKNILYGRYSSRYTRKTRVGYAAPWGKFVRLDLLKNHNISFDSYLMGVFDDGLYSLNLLEHCGSLYYMHEKTYNYRVVSGSLTHSFKLNAMELQRRGYERIEQFMLKTSKDNDFWEAYYAHVVVFLGGYLSRYYFNSENEKNSETVLKELIEDLSSEPFRTAAQRVNLKKLSLKDKWLALCERAVWVPGLKAYVVAKNAAKTFNLN